MRTDELHFGQRHNLEIFFAHAVIDYDLVRQGDTAGRAIVGHRGGDHLRTLLFDCLRQQMCLGVEPGVERLSAHRRDGQHLESRAAFGFLAVVHNLGAAAIWPPPLTRNAIRIVCRKHLCVTALLQGDRSRRVFFPGICSVEAVGAGCRTHAEIALGTTGFEIIDGMSRACQAESGEGELGAHRDFPVPRAAAGRGLVGVEDLSGRRCGERRSRIGCSDRCKYGDGG